MHGGAVRRLVLLVASVSLLAVAIALSGVPSAGLALGLLPIVGAAGVIGLDSAFRGRSPIRWLLACGLLPPVGLPAFVVVAVTDRLAGRHGVEAAWPRPWRGPMLAAIALALVAAGLALAPLNVKGATVSVDGGFASYSGQCGSALAVAIGEHPWSEPSPAVLSGAGGAAAAAGAQRAVADRCLKGSGHRLSFSVGLLFAALVTLAGAALLTGRRRPRPTGRHPGEARSPAV